LFLPYQEPECLTLELPEIALREVSVKILREDQNHEEVSGNKWWRLKYNLLQASMERKPILTFGGAFSNHLYATAAAAACLKIPSIGIVRGGPFPTPGPTLEFVRQKGMALHHISKEKYREKESEEVIKELHGLFGEFLVVPEGGSNEAAIRGCEEWGQKLLSTYDFDVVCLPVGSGGTVSGLIKAFGGRKEVIGFSALKDGAQLVEVIKKLSENSSNRWQIESGFHFGGYAKTKPVLIDFMQKIYADKKLPLDAVYTSKALWGLLALIEMGRFTPGQKILFIHTGGLQGNLGFFNSKFPGVLRSHRAKA